MKIRYQNIDRIIVGKMHRDAEYVMAEDHCHPYFELYYVRLGKCCFFLQDNLYPLEAGDFLLVSPNELHHTLYLEGESCERITVYFKESFLTRAVRPVPGLTVIREAYRETMLSFMDRMLLESKIGDEYSPALLSCCLEQLFLLLGRYQCEPDAARGIPGTGDTAILDAVKYIGAHFSSPLPLREAAAAAGFSPSHFSRKFKALTGVGFKEYLNYVRLKNAAAELLSTRRSVTDIALSNGFSSGNYFKDTFKKAYGCSPREYRNLKNN